MNKKKLINCIAVSSGIGSPNHGTMFGPEALKAFNEAKQQILKKADFYGLSLDMDVFDPTQIPGVGLPVKNGIDFQDVYAGLNGIVNDNKFIGAEIEYILIQK